MKKITAGDPETRSVDVLAENVERLKTLFPEAFTGGKIDFEVLRQLLGGAVEEREEKYGLNWHGKRQARQIALTPSTGTLRPCLEDSVAWDTTQNLIVEGDNLEVLKLLQKSYAGKVKLIYIDPPYNTGKDFVYPDKFQDNIRNYLELTGQVEGGAKISSNAEASGRFHTDWLNMMYPRLQLARDLLQENGVIIVSIDDHEVVGLRQLLDEIFGEENFLGQITVVSNPRGRQSERIATTHEYVVVFARFSDAADMIGERLSSSAEAEYKYLTPDQRRYRLRGLRHRGNASRRQDRPNSFYPLFVNPKTRQVSTDNAEPFTEEVLPRKITGEDGRWEWGPVTVRQRLDRLEGVFITRRGSWDVYQREFLEDEAGSIRTMKWKSVWEEKEINYQNAKSDLRALFGENPFDYPKPLQLIQRLVEGVTSGCDLVVDFFAGSGSTGHAVMLQNLTDGGTRRYILVQLPEALDRDGKGQNPAADFCDKIGRPRNIAELTKERLRRAGKKVKDENPLFPGDIGFRVFKLDTSNIRAWDPDREELDQTLLDNIEHIKPGRSEQDVLYELLLKLGLDLCVPMETRTLAGKVVHSIGAGTLVVCLDEQISREEVEPLALGIAEWHKEIAPATESTVVFRDSAFADDVAKTNLDAILRQHGLENLRSL